MNTEKIEIPDIRFSGRRWDEEEVPECASMPPGPARDQREHMMRCPVYSYDKRPVTITIKDDNFAVAEGVARLNVSTFWYRVILTKEDGKWHGHSDTAVTSKTNVQGERPTHNLYVADCGVKGVIARNLARILNDYERDKDKGA